MAISSLRELIECSTILTGQHTVREHLSALTCDLIHADVIYIPIGTLDINVNNETNNLDFTEPVMNVEYTLNQIDAIITEDTFSVDIQNDTKDIDNGCS